jgi:hypothetical protein
MYDRKLTTYSEMLTKQVAIGQSIPDEGAVLVYVEEDGIQKVQRSAGAAGETLAGFSAIDNYQPTMEIQVESGAVPAAGSFEISLSHANLVPNQIRVFDVDANADLDLVATSPAAGEFSANNTTGVLTFNANEAGHAIVVFYKYFITVAESVMTYHERHANAGASDFWEVLEVIGGQGEIWTDQYDVSKDYRNLGANDLCSGANGLITVGGDGTPIGIVIHVPDQANPMLGVKYTITNKVGA